ncbi:MAG: selenocysteine-specific translation elongation factor [Candidatus Cloacimonetes bacterium]|nr:selenocysteine-specific translation elongation factor [Candidatus Cloacimonadota bacterium]
MKHLIMGTAGHIDHGKTTLIQALTGFNCDTHAEEKARGITINLGFTNLKLPSGNAIGIVDVPGHKDFVNTMIAGVSGIDFVMLVIAADSGVMPQTIEHLNILKILGIKRGFVVLTKSDLVDEELIEAGKEEIAEVVKGSFLEGKPIISVSARTGEGLGILIEMLEEEFSHTAEKEPGSFFRMYIDRIFQVKGFGTVINGSVLSGSITKDNKLYLLPSNKDLRIRRIERHHEETDAVYTGDRASLNVVGLRYDEFERGMLISDKVLKPTILIDAELTLFNQLREFGIWTQVVFLSGTYQSVAKVHLIDRNKLESGETAIVQMHFTKQAVLLYKDHFIIRNSSGDITLGGGKILDAYPNKHKRRPPKLINDLQELSQGDAAIKIVSEIRKRITPPTIKEISEVINLPEDSILNMKDSHLKDEIQFITANQNHYLVLKSKLEEWKKKILSLLTNHHKRFPLDMEGKTLQELLGVLGGEQNQDFNSIFKYLLDSMTEAGDIKAVNKSWVINSHEILLSDKEEQSIKAIESFFEKCDMTLPLVSNLDPVIKQFGINEAFLKQVLSMLVKKEVLFKADDFYLHSSIVMHTRNILLKHLNESREGIKVSEFRDLIDGNRKICLVLLQIFEKKGWLIRRDDLRFISSEGIAIAKELSN